MSKKKLDQYKGKLNAKKITEGMNAAAQNAKRLLHDANILLEAGRYPTASSLAILSIEEAGKLAVLRGLAVVKDGKEVASHWRRYRTHTKKNVTWLLPQLAVQGARKLEDFRSLFDEKSVHPYLLDNIKQIGFYTDCLGKTHWSVPDDVIDEELAKSMVKIAEIMIPKGDVTIREMELWMEHMIPESGENFTSMKEALENWYGAMREEGLSSHSAEEINKFIRGPSPKP